MKVFFLSDLHLTDENEQAKRLEAFLRELPAAGDVLVLGGDIFDLFVGNKAVFRRRFSGVLGALRDLGERGGAIYFLEGNHDFHMNGVFASHKNTKVMADSFPLLSGDRKIWISHGDLIDPEDTGYRFLRWFTRLGPVRALIGLLPGGWIDAIGRKSSRESRKYNNTDRVSADRRDRLRQLYQAYAQAKVKEGYAHVLLGHSHLEDHVALEGGEYLNLGFFPDRLVYGTLEEGSTSFQVSFYP